MILNFYGHVTQSLWWNKIYFYENDNTVLHVQYKIGLLGWFNVSKMLTLLCIITFNIVLCWNSNVCRKCGSLLLYANIQTSFIQKHCQSKLVQRNLIYSSTHLITAQVDKLGADNSRQAATWWMFNRIRLKRLVPPCAKVCEHVLLLPVLCMQFVSHGFYCRDSKSVCAETILVHLRMSPPTILCS